MRQAQTQDLGEGWERNERNGKKLHSGPTSISLTIILDYI